MFNTNGEEIKTILLFITHFYKMPGVSLVVDVWKERLHEGPHSGRPIYTTLYNFRDT